MCSESILRSVFFWLMEPGELAAHLERERQYFTDAATFYRVIGAAKDRGEFADSPQTHSLRISSEAGERLFQALADWAEWAQERTRGEGGV